MKNLVTTTATVVVTLGVLFKPVLYPFLVSFKASKFDTDIGRIPVLKSKAELQSIYKGKKVLIIGGTRGVGRGIALCVAKAGADATVVGRSKKSGAAIVDLMQQKIREDRQAGVEAGENQSLMQHGAQIIHYIQGDIGSVRTATACIKSLNEYASKHGKFDYLIVTAAIFPYWNDLINEDGLERSFGITVIGRYLIYNNAELFLKPNTGRILNVLASGMDSYPFDRDLASGKRIDGSLFSFVMNFACGNEMMQLGLGQRNSFYSKLTRVSSHPGILKTDLHRGQGWLMDVIEGIIFKFVGFTEEEAGIRQASLLASNLLVEGRINYVDEFMKGRLLGSKMSVTVNDHLDWLMELIDKTIGSRLISKLKSR